MKKYILAGILFLCCFTMVYSQISTGEKPYSWHNIASEVKTALPEFTLPGLDIEALQQEDKQRQEAASPSRFGVANEVNLTLQNAGTWKQMPDGGRLWTLKITSPDAKSLNLNYDKFWLPEGGKFYIYSADKKQSLGAYTSLNNKGDRDDIKGFATELVYSNEIILEYYEPAGVSGGIISIDNVVSGYRSINEVIAVCANISNDEWENQKNSLAIMVTGNVINGVGVLVNNTQNNNDPYVMAITPENISSTGTILYWGTSGLNYSGAKTTVGLQILIEKEIDFRVEPDKFYLLKLNGTPFGNTDGFSPYYLGWDYTDNIVATYTNMHPLTSYWRITALPDDQPQTNDYAWLFNSQYNTIAREEERGSPLFDDYHNLIGLFNSEGTNMSNKGTNNLLIYAKFKYLWNLNTGRSDGKKLKDFLDPYNISNGSWGGIGEGCTTLRIINQTFSTSRTITGCHIEMQNVTINNNATVLVNGQDIILKPDFIASAGTTVVFKANNNSTRNAFADTESSDIKNATGILESPERSFGAVNLYPNPTTGHINLDIPSDMKVSAIEVHDMTGRTVLKNSYSNNPIEIDLSGNAAGMYILRIYYDGGLHDQKIMIK